MSIHRTNKLFPTGTKIGATDELIPSSSGSSTFSAEPDLFIANPNTAHLLHYKFLFWNVCGTFSTNSAGVSGTPSGTKDVATAWYVLVGGGDGGGEGINTYAFWVEDDSVVSDTPIASVTPTGNDVWAGGNSTIVSPSAGGTDARVITALTSVPHITNAVLQKWFPLGPGETTPKPDATLTVHQGVSTTALALYNGEVKFVGRGTPPSVNPDKTTKPGPISLDGAKLIEILTTAQTRPASDRLTQTLRKGQPSFAAEDLRGVVLELNANINQLQSAVDLITARLAGKQTP